MKTISKIVISIILITETFSCKISNINRNNWELKQIKDGKITVFDLNNDKIQDLIVSGYQSGGDIDYRQILFIESDKKNTEAPGGKWEERGYSFYLDRRKDLWLKTEGKSWRVKNNNFRSNVTAKITVNGNLDINYNEERISVKNNQWEIPGLKIWLDESSILWVKEGEEEKVIASGNWKRKFNVMVNPVDEWIKGTALKRGGKTDEKNIPVGDEVVAIDGKRKKIIWQFKAKDEITSYPSVYEEKVFFGSKDGNMYALDLKSGKKVWQYKTNGEIYTTPALSKNTIYFGNRAGIFYALDARSGSLLWSFRTENYRPIDSSAVVYDEKIYFGSWDKNFYALDALSGQLIWKRKFNSYIGQISPAAGYDKIFFGAWDRNLYALDALTGNTVWTLQTNDWIDRASPVVANGMVYIGNKNGNLYAANSANGFLKWQFKTGDAITSAPAVSKNRVYLTSRDGYLYAINPERGRLLWERNSRFKIYTSPAIGVNEVYFSNSGGYLYAISDNESEQALWPMHGGEPSHRGTYSGAVAFGKKLIKEKSAWEKWLEENGLKFEIKNRNINARY